MSDGDGELLTLQEAADHLKVHYMTAYRWVRRGQLPAFKAGGRLRVRRRDIEQYLQAREVDVATQSPDGQQTDWRTHADRLFDLLMDGRSTDVSAMVNRIVADGAPAGDVYVHLLAPAMHRIGEEWAAGRISIAEEHRASAIVHTLLARLGELFRRRGPKAGTAVTLTPPGDRHALGVAMAADFLRGARFEVHHLGADVPLADVRTFLEAVPCDLVVVSITFATVEPAVLAALVRNLHDLEPAPRVVFGGQGIDADGARAAGAEFAASLQDLVHAVHASGTASS